jgi:ABC-type transporter Mla MlaB component
MRQRRGLLARRLMFMVAEEGNVLEIIRTATAHDRVAYSLSGEITFDQLARLEALVSEERESGMVVTLDLAHVWRVDREAAAVIARHARNPDDGVRVRGLSTGLLEWLGTVVQERP